MINYIKIRKNRFDDMDEFDQKWELFEKECKDCKDCELCAKRTNVVIYRGARKAPLMIIGEAPGESEDLEGKPFVGRSGKLLQNLIKAYGIKDSDYHICNICKCRPPENRRPTPTEIHACKKHLAKQFRLVEPKIILLCGSTAYEGFFNEKPLMSSVRGNFTTRNGYEIMTTYHPAYALRNPKMKIPMMEDFEKVYKRLVELSLIEPSAEINPIN
ncbi:MAG: uracil-DNA glycosylase [Clostridiales bacterium]|nr:uracil-DNA glycosylase [Clostridiales bacterium]